MATAVGIIVTIAFSATLAPKFLHDFDKVYGGEWAMARIASGRPALWMANLREFSTFTIDRRLAGVGIGNRVHPSEYVRGRGEVRESHNDYLEVLVQTGIVGFTLFLGLQFLVLRGILNLQGKEKKIFLALFLAVIVMNFASNSYVSRFGLAQMYYLQAMTSNERCLLKAVYDGPC